MPFDSAWCESRCRELALSLGSAIVHRPVTESTNDDALLAAKAGGAHGSVVVADKQTRGRGRRGNSWASPAAEGLTFSVLLRGRFEGSQLSVLPLVVGLAVREVVGQLVPGEALVKWPNDVWVNGRKLCGILVESFSRAGTVQALVVGIGLNVSQRGFEGPLAGSAVSLWQLGIRDVSREKLLVSLLAAKERRLRELTQTGFLRQWRELNEFDALRGSRVRVDRTCGVACGIKENGALLLREAGQITEVVAGTVELLSLPVQR